MEEQKTSFLPTNYKVIEHSKLYVRVVITSANK